MEILEIIKNRRSIRDYAAGNIPPDALDDILKAGLLSPSSKNIRPLEFITIKDKDTLKFLSTTRTHGSAQLEKANVAVVTIADTTEADAWIEDASIAMSNMMLTAQSYGIGSCWIQIRMRKNNEGKLSSEAIKEKLNIPSGYEVEAILSLGIPKNTLEPQEWENTQKDKIHKEQY